MGLLVFKISLHSFCLFKIDNLFQRFTLRDPVWLFRRCAIECCMSDWPHWGFPPKPCLERHLTFTKRGRVLWMEWERTIWFPPALSAPSPRWTSDEPPAASQKKHTCPNDFKWPQMNPDDRRWPQTGPNETTWFHMTPGDPQWRQINPHEPTWPQLTPDDSKSPQMIPDDSRWPLMTADDSGWIQITPDPSRWLHMTPDSSGRPQVTPHYSKWAKMTQDHSRIPRWPQMVPD